MGSILPGRGPMFQMVSVGAHVVAFTLIASCAARAQPTAIAPGRAGQTSGQVMNIPPGMPNAIITGYVVDENGRPARVMVQVWAEMTAPDGVRRQLSNGTRPTDDQGQFTIDRLQPGEYFVAVFPNAGSPSPFAPSSTDATTYAVTYYPGVTSIEEAQRIAATTLPQ